MVLEFAFIGTIFDGIFEIKHACAIASTIWLNGSLQSLGKRNVAWIILPNEESNTVKSILVGALK